MGATNRTAEGRFGSEYHPLEFYELVRVVAVVAAPDEPTLVSEVAWDAARAAAGYPDAPSARAICMRLADLAGQSFSWRKLLELSFDESRDIEQTHALRMGVAMDGTLEEADVYYALRRIAHAELSQASLGPGEYRRERERLIAVARRRRNGPNGGHGTSEIVSEVLPTVGQIERVAGDWDAALVIAELEPRPAVHRYGGGAPGLPIAEVLDRFADETDGWFCRPRQLRQYARDRALVVAGRKTGSSWTDFIAEATTRRDARGAIVRGLPPAGVILSYSGMGEGEGRAALSKHAAKPAGYWTLERCVNAVRRYLEDPATNGSPSQARYRAWAVGRPDAPAPSTFAAFGGWTVVRKLAQKRGPLPADLRTPSRSEQREAVVLEQVDEHGRIVGGDVRALLGVSGDTATRILGELVRRGVLAIGGKNTTGRWVYYVRAGE